VPVTGPFSGAVLCGGASTRMGRDKATLEVDGQAMAVRVADALREAGAAEVLAIGGDPAALEPLGLPVVPDDEPGQGPFPATLTALRHATSDVVIVLSCDLVSPSAATIASLVDRLHACDPPVLAAIPVVDGQHQWTHAAWRRREALDALAAARLDGIGSLRRAAAGLPIVAVHDVPEADVADADDPLDLPGAR
jgi:molybdopterin-guanine dinucleotide biosynthesis protein A